MNYFLDPELIIILQKGFESLSIKDITLHIKINNCFTYKLIILVQGKIHFFSFMDLITENLGQEYGKTCFTIHILSSPGFMSNIELFR